MTVQLGMLGVPDRRGREYVPPFIYFTLGGCPIPLPRGAVRQIKALTPDTHRFDFLPDDARLPDRDQPASPPTPAGGTSA